MNRKEYENLKRFETQDNINFDSLCQSIRIGKDTMLEIYSINNSLIYAKITDEFSNLLFDVKETDRNGEPVRHPLYANMLSKNQIAERIYKGDWRIIK